METLTLKAIYDALDKMKNYTPPKNYYWISERWFWEWERKNIKLFNWTDKELDNVKDDGFIGRKIGVDCYLPLRIAEN